MSKPKAKKDLLKVGRKPFDGVPEHEVLRKLEQVFSLGGSDAEACLFADISKQTLYAYQKAHPEYVDRKDQLKQSPILKARQELIMGLSGNPELALKYLERKMSSEFAPKTNLNLSGKVKSENSIDFTGITLDELKKIAKE